MPGGKAVQDRRYRIIVREDAKGKPKVLAYVVPQTVTGREASALFLACPWTKLSRQRTRASSMTCPMNRNGNLGRR